MRRRALLSGLTAGLAGLAGCSIRSDREPTDTLSPVEPPAAEPSPTPAGGDEDDGFVLGGAEVATLGTGPRTLAMTPSIRGPDGARVTAEFVATATADRPARVRATLTNGNDWTNTFRLREIPPLMEVNHASIDDGGDGESTLYLAPTADHDLVDADPTVQRGPDGYWRITDVPASLPRTVRLDAGESVTGEYLLVGHWERAGFPTGTYRFGYDDSLSIDAWHSERPGPEGTSRFARASVPSLPGAEDGEPTEWYHEADATTPVFLRPSAERAEPPTALRFSLVNHSTEPVGGNPYDWGLYKLVDGSWHRIEPWAIPMPASAVSPGDTWDYTLRAFHERYRVTYDYEDYPDAKTVGRLGGGTYAFEAGFARESHGTPAALFELDAPQLDVEPPEGLRVQRRGDRVVVTDDVWNDDEHPPNAKLLVERVEDADRSLVAEQLYHGPNETLRKAVPYFEAGVSTVVLRTDEHAAERVVGYDDSRSRFQYGDAAYEATVERTET